MASSLKGSKKLLPDRSSTATIVLASKSAYFVKIGLVDVEIIGLTVITHYAVSCLNLSYTSLSLLYFALYRSTGQL